ncbi:ATP-binding protein [Antrihabitans cavernicola]|uniref:ATP-binding protein n=1 Tax=Antrihabitans cavernicola TaxID=2495913 RepID=A0A5A7S5Y6_9NOCA|nr:ATP-binding protein [Spelaeibacter cavernicola]KAA0017366.1 ATP-binding protein [Spelaeibacter cavernicola]
MSEVADNSTSGTADVASSGSWSTEATPTGAAVLRKALTFWLSTNFDLSRERLSDIALAANEALANVVEHAYGITEDLPLVELDVMHDTDSGRIVVTVTDRGHWRIPAADPLHLRGRGLPLMKALASDVVFDKADSGTRVRLTWEIERAR